MLTSAWQTPITHATGDVIGVATWNQEVVTNLAVNWRRAWCQGSGQGSVGSSNTDCTVTPSAAFVNNPGCHCTNTDFVADYAGLFLFTVTLVWSPQSASGTLSCVLVDSAGTYGFIGGGYHNPVDMIGAYNWAVSCSTTQNMAAGDSVKFQVWQNTGADINVVWYVNMFQLSDGVL